MELIKYADFKPNQIGYIVYSGVEYKVITIDDTHYIGAFLSTAQAAPVSLDGLRYNLIAKSDGNPIDINSETVDSEIYRIPTGFTQNMDLGEFEPKAFIFRNIVVFERPDLTDSALKLVDVDMNILAEILDMGISDRLILILDQDIDWEHFHINARSPHVSNKNLLTQSRINEFNTSDPEDTHSGRVPYYRDLTSVFQIHRMDDRCLVDTYLEITKDNQNNFIYTWRGVYNIYDTPTLFMFKNTQY